MIDKQLECVASIIVLIYNQEATIIDAANSCLEQEGGPYEIIFSDDASVDSSFEILQKLLAKYDGPHHVKLRRNNSNKGIGEHVNVAISACSCDFIMCAAGDDISLPCRASKLYQAWEASKFEACLISSYVFDMDYDDTVHGIIQVDDLSKWRCVDDWIKCRPYVVGASHAFSKKLIDKFGYLNPENGNEDQVLAFRASLLGAGITLSEPLVKYRRGGISSRKIKADGNMLLDSVRRQTRRLLAENYQFISDAKCLGLEKRVSEALAQPILNLLFVQAMLDAKTLYQRLYISAKPSELPFSWRFRKALYFSFPGITAWFKRVKSKRRTKK